MSSIEPTDVDWLVWRRIAALPHAPEDPAIAVGSIETIEIEWLAWVARAMRRPSLGFDEMVEAAEAQLMSDREEQEANLAGLWNAQAISRHYGFDAATLLDRLHPLDPLQRMQVLDLVESSR